MKLIGEVSADKLTGSFYTPAPIVDFCYRRLASLLRGRTTLDILEPSAGDGAFIRGLDRSSLARRVARMHLTCVEIDATESRKCATEMQRSTADGRVINQSFFPWAAGTHDSFDVLVGNPPFVRYQFVPPADRQVAESLLGRDGTELDGVSNLWIPFVLVGLQLLRPGGAFALVLPSELFSTKSAGLIRSELVRHFCSLRVDVFPRDAFPGILQDVVVISGKRDLAVRSAASITFAEGSNSAVSWDYEVPDSGRSWTEYLLPSREREALHRLNTLSHFQQLGQVATIGVAIVTGANSFFTVSDAIVEAYDLRPWARPLLARTVDSPGLVFTSADHSHARSQGKAAWILDFAADRPDPRAFGKPALYLSLGEERGLAERYKCRVREPWYRVPDIRAGSLMMSKRSHRFHRLLCNEAMVYTTDTIYRGEMKPLFRKSMRDLVAGFHNTGTLLCAELQGRSYGGGVLELVPSELAQLRVPLADLGGRLLELDALSRASGGQLNSSDALVEATDRLVSQAVAEYEPLLPALRSARCRLRRRRFGE